MKTRQQTKIIIVLLVLLTAFNVLACRVRSQPSEESMQLMHLTWRAERQVLLEEDFTLIDKYLKQEVAPTDKDLVMDFQLPINTFAQLIAKYQFDEVYLQQFKAWALMLKESKQRKYSRDLDDIIWWSEARMKFHYADLMALKQTNNNADKVEEVMALFVELGMVNELKAWSTEVSFEKSVLLFDLAIRKAKMVNFFDELPVNFVEQIEHEFISSLNAIFPILADGNLVEDQHLHWLFIEMGKNRGLPEVHSMLVTLEKNPLYYHQEQLLLAQDKAKASEYFTNEDEVLSTINERLDIIPWAMEALNPGNLYSSSSYYGCS